MKIYPYSQKSASAKSLAEALGIKRIKHEGKILRVKGTLINWGCSQFSRGMVIDNILNKPQCVAVSVNKLQSFKHLLGHVPIPSFTEDAVEASKWLAEGFDVVARTVLTGHSGKGIAILSPGDELVKAPLYVKYIPKKEEFRVHVFHEDVFFIQQKKRKKDVPDGDVNWGVRNLKGGFIYANKDIDLPKVAQNIAVQAVKTLGLDFGAVDIIYNEKKNEYYVLEVNTACGLTGTTLDKYVEVFSNFQKGE